MRVSDFFESICCLIFSVLAALAVPMIASDDGVQPWPKIEAILVLCSSLFFLFAAVAFGKYYILTEQGIQHKFLGICYRKTEWTEIQDVMRTVNQTGERWRPRVLYFTTNRASRIYRPNEHGYVETKGFFRDWLTGRIFMVRSADPHVADKAVAYVEQHYGPLDYDYFKETDKKH